MIFPNYEYFLRIAEYENISKAAESLYISQPSLSKYLKKLEESVGTELFERKQSSLRLTDGGRAFLEYVRNVEKEEKNLLTHVAEIRSGERATITIGMPLWRSSVILPDFLPGFYARHPLVNIRLLEGSAETLENHLMNDRIDFCIMNLPVDYTNVTFDIIAEEYIFLLGAKTMPAVQRLTEKNTLLTGHPSGSPYPCVNISDLVEEPFILNQQGQHITNYVNSMLSQNNVNLHCILRSSNVTTSINLAAAGIGFAFVPELGTHSRFFPKDAVTLFTVNDPPLRCGIAAVWKKSGFLTATAQVFIRELQEYAVKLLG